ncbi:hypothetical protein HN51_066249, partial [Arachis hypogaea]
RDHHISIASFLTATHSSKKRKSPISRNQPRRRDTTVADLDPDGATRTAAGLHPDGATRRQQILTQDGATRTAAGLHPDGATQTAAGLVRVREQVSVGDGVVLSSTGVGELLSSTGVGELLLLLSQLHVAVTFEKPLSFFLPFPCLASSSSQAQTTLHAAVTPSASSAYCLTSLEDPHLLLTHVKANLSHRLDQNQGDKGSNQAKIAQQPRRKISEIGDKYSRENSMEGRNKTLVDNVMNRSLRSSQNQ